MKPFAQTTTGANYQGDDGVRLLQVEASRDMPTNISGIELFTQIKNGNGYLSDRRLRERLAGSGSAGGGGESIRLRIWGRRSLIRAASAMSTAWTNAALAATTALAIPATTPQQYRDLELRFSINNTVTPPVTEYNVFRN